MTNTEMPNDSVTGVRSTGLVRHDPWTSHDMRPIFGYPSNHAQEYECRICGVRYQYGSGWSIKNKVGGYTHSQSDRIGCAA